jgi:hypothetical protein
MPSLKVANCSLDGGSCSSGFLSASGTDCEQSDSSLHEDINVWPTVYTLPEFDKECMYWIQKLQKHKHLQLKPPIRRSIVNTLFDDIKKITP